MQICILIAQSQGHNILRRWVMLLSVVTHGMCFQWCFKTNVNKRKKRQKGQFISSIVELLCRKWETCRVLHPDPHPVEGGFWLGKEAVLGSNQKMEFVGVSRTVSFCAEWPVTSGKLLFSYSGSNISNPGQSLMSLLLHKLFRGMHNPVPGLLR